MRRDEIKYGDRIVYEALNGNTLTIIAGKSFDGMNIADFTIKLGTVRSIERPHYQKIYSRVILDTKEKEYLSAVIKPFRNKVNKITKKQYEDIEWICVSFANNDWFSLPAFNKNKMYKGMNANRDYLLEELGL